MTLQALIARPGLGQDPGKGGSALGKGHPHGCRAKTASAHGAHGVLEGLG